LVKRLIVNIIKNEAFENRINDYMFPSDTQIKPNYALANFKGVLSIAPSCSWGFMNNIEWL